MESRLGIEGADMNGPSTLSELPVYFTSNVDVVEFCDKDKVKRIKSNRYRFVDLMMTTTKGLCNLVYDMVLLNPSKSCMVQ